MTQFVQLLDHIGRQLDGIVRRFESADTAGCFAPADRLAPRAEPRYPACQRLGPFEVVYAPYPG